jgi:hypothetical protein
MKKNVQQENAEYYAHLKMISSHIREVIDQHLAELPTLVQGRLRSDLGYSGLVNAYHVANSIRPESIRDL